MFAARPGVNWPSVVSTASQGTEGEIEKLRGWLSPVSRAMACRAGAAPWANENSSAEGVAKNGPAPWIFQTRLSMVVANSRLPLGVVERLDAIRENALFRSSFPQGIQPYR